MEQPSNPQPCNRSSSGSDPRIRGRFAFSLSASTANTLIGRITIWLSLVSLLSTGLSLIVLGLKGTFTSGT